MTVFARKYLINCFLISMCVWHEIAARFPSKNFEFNYNYQHWNSKGLSVMAMFRSYVRSTRFRQKETFISDVSALDEYGIFHIFLVITFAICSEKIRGTSGCAVP